MYAKVFGRKLCVNTENPMDTAGSPPPKPKAPKRRPGKRPKK